MSNKTKDGLSLLSNNEKVNSSLRPTSKNTTSKNTTSRNVTSENVADNVLSKISGLLLFNYSVNKKSLISLIGDTEEVLGVPRTKVSAEANLFLRYVHSEDRFLVFEAFESALLEGSYNMSYRWIRPDNEKTIKLHCHAHIDSETQYLHGYIHTESPKAETNDEAQGENVHNVLNAFPESIISIDINGKILSIYCDLEKEVLEQFGINSEKLSIDQFFEASCSNDIIIKAIKKIQKGGERELLSFSALEHQSYYRLEIMPVRTKGKNNSIVLRIWDYQIAPFSDHLLELQRAYRQYQKRVHESAIHINNTLHAISTHGEILAKQHQNKNIYIIQSLAEHTAELVSSLGSTEEDVKSNVRTNINSCLLRALEEVQKLRDDVGINVKFGIVEQVYCVQFELTPKVSTLLREIVLAAPPGTNIQVSSFKDKDTVRCDISVQLPIATSNKNLANIFLSEELDSLGESGLLSFLLKFNGMMRKDLRISSCLNWQLSLEPIQNLIETKTSNKKIDYSKPLILIIDDDPIILETLDAIFEKNNIQVLTALKAKEALELVKKHSSQISAIMLDALLSDQSGAVLVRQLKKLYPNIPVIGFSGASKRKAESLLLAGADLLLYKPLSPTELINNIRPYTEKQI